MPRAMLCSTPRYSMHYANTVCRMISATTVTSNASGRPALTGSIMIEIRSGLNMIDIVNAKRAIGQADFEA